MQIGMGHNNAFLQALRSGEALDAEGVFVRVSRQAVEEAADILDLLFNQMQAHSPNMSGEMSYRLRGSGWPMTHCRGFGQLDALRNVLAEVKREREGGAE